MPIYMTPPDGLDPNLPQGPSSEANVDYFIKGESAQADYFKKLNPALGNAGMQDVHHAGGVNAGPGGGPHTQRSGVQGILIGLLLFSLVGILIGLSIFIFAPLSIAGGAATLLIGNRIPTDPCTSTSPSDAANLMSISGGSSDPLAGILIGLNNVRVSIGGESLFQGGCSQELRFEPPPAPTPDANGSTNPNGDPTKTPIPANTNSNTSGGEQQPNTSGGGEQPGADPCLPNNGGMASYEPAYCNCNGTTSTIIFCQDGTRIETTNPNGSCQPDPVICQPPSTDGGGQQPPTCEYKCYVSDPNKPEQCLQGGWVYPGTDTYCDPNNP